MPLLRDRGLAQHAECFTVAAQRRIFTYFTICATSLEFITDGPSLASASGVVLVGLLTSERENPAFSSLPASAAGRRQWLPRGGLLVTLGYSGGAVPDLHRCSLFVGHPSVGTRPPTHVEPSSLPGPSEKATPTRAVWADFATTAAVRGYSPFDTPGVFDPCGRLIGGGLCGGWPRRCVPATCGLRSGHCVGTRLRAATDYWLRASRSTVDRSGCFQDEGQGNGDKGIRGN